MKRAGTRVAALAAISWSAFAEAPRASVDRLIEAQGGEVVRGPDGAIVEVSLARTWATDSDVERLAEIATLKRLNLSLTYVTDRGIEKLQGLRQLEELDLDTAEFVTDASISYLRANRALRKLRFRGVDITDAGMPNLAALTGLVSLDLSHTMLGDVGLESLPAFAGLEELHLGGTRISGINLNFLRLLPKLRKLRFNGIQRRNAGACWSPLITDLDLEAIAQLQGLEELNLGVGFSLGKAGKPVGGGNCQVSGGIQVTNLGLSKVARLKNLKRLDVSGAKINAAGIEALKALPSLEGLSLWNCVQLNDSGADALAALANLTNLDLAHTSVGDATLARLADLKRLRSLYLTGTGVTPAGVEAFRAKRPDVFVSRAEAPK
jgi:Leucine-rich repeat (LRR) protein